MPPTTSGNEVLREQVERYFRANAKAWKSFATEFLAVTPDVPLLVLAKFFVIRSNQPFDMSTYMKTQAEHIKLALEDDLEKIPPAERQKLVADWLRHNAQSHRDQIILDQARLLDDCCAALEPFLRELISQDS